MTCFWDGLMQALNKLPLKTIIKDTLKIEGKINAQIFAEALKKNNCMTDNVLWNSTPLLEQFKQENMMMISGFDTTHISQGYLCSSCDPFLLLISQLFKTDIYHHYNGHNIEYKNSQSNGNIIRVSSDKGHFWSQ